MASSSFSSEQALYDSLHLLNEQSLMSDNRVPKYASKTVDTLSRYLFSRNYSALTYELAHLLWLLCHTESENSVLEFFFVEEAVYPHQAKRYLCASEFTFANPDIICEIVELDASIAIFKHRFRIHLSRVNLLSAMFEWLINHEPQIISTLHDSLWSKGESAIKQLASDFQKRIYRRIDDVVDSSRNQQRFEFFKTTYESTNPADIESKFTQAWASAGNIQGLSRLTSFFESTCAWMASHDSKIQGVWTESESLESVSYDEISMHSDGFIENLFNVDTFEGPPKLFSQRQLDDVRLMFNFPFQWKALPQSASICAMFEKLQGKLIQQSRVGSASNEQLININADEALETQMKNTIALSKVAAINAHATLSIVHEHFNREFLSLITAKPNWLNAINKSATALAEHNQISTLTPDEVSQRSDVYENELNILFESFIHSMKKDLAKINRKGFTETTLIDDVEVYKRAAIESQSMAEWLSNWVDKLQRVKKSDGEFEKFSSNCYIVQHELTERYKNNV